MPPTTSVGVKVPIGGDITPLLNEFAKLPGRTAHELAAIASITRQEISRGAVAKAFAELPGVAGKEAKKAAAMVSRELQKTAAEAIRVEQQVAAARAAILEKARENAKHIQKQWLADELKAAKAREQIAEDMVRKIEATEAKAKGGSGSDVESKRRQGLGAIVGQGWVNDIDDVTAAIGTLGPVAGTAAAGGVALGVAFAGAAVEIAATATATYAIVSTFYAAADATGELKDEQALLEQQMSSLHQTVGRDFVPQAEQVTTGLAAMALATQDAYNAAGEARTRFEQTTGIWRGTERALFDLATNQGLVNTAMHAGGIELVKYLDPFGKYEDRLKGVAAAEQARLDAVKRAQQAKNFVPFGPSPEQLAVVGKAREEADRKAEKRAAEAEAARKKREKEAAADAERAAAIANRQRQQEWEDEQALDAQFAANAEAIEDSRAKAGEKLAAKESKAADDARAAWTTAYEGIGGAIQSVTQMVIDGAQGGSKSMKDAALVAFRLQQSAASAQAAISAVELGIKLSATMAPLGPAGVAIATGIAIAQGAAAQAAIWSQPPPSFHVGGMPRQSALAPDETMARVRKNEIVETRQQQRQNREPTQVLALQLGHKLFNATVRQNLKQTGSPLRQGIIRATGNMVGRRKVK